MISDKIFFFVCGGKGDFDFEQVGQTIDFLYVKDIISCTVYTYDSF